MTDIRIAFMGQGKDLNEFSSDLFETDSFGEGTKKDIPGGTITMLPMTVEKSAEISRVIEVVLSVGRDVSVGVVAAYIYEKLRAQPRGSIHMMIKRREVHQNQSEITKVIEEIIEIQ
jgi:hypothetical protein